MAQRSSIDRLPPAARAQVDQAIHAGATIDAIVDLVVDLHDKGELAEPPSRSAIGRYSKDFRQLAERQRDMSSVAKAFAGEFGSEDDRQVRLLIQLATSTLTRSAMAFAAGEDEGLPALKDAANLARAVKDLTAAAKIDVDREAKIREEAKKEAAAESRRKLDAAGKRGELDPEALARAKRILGFDG